MAPKPTDSMPCWTPGTPHGRAVARTTGALCLGLDPHTGGGGKDYRSALPGPGSPFRLRHPG